MDVMVASTVGDGLSDTDTIRNSAHITDEPIDFGEEDIPF